MSRIQNEKENKNIHTHTYSQCIQNYKKCILYWGGIMNLENKTVEKKTVQEKRRKKITKSGKLWRRNSDQKERQKKRTTHTHKDINTQIFLTICKKVYLFRDTTHCNRNIEQIMDTQKCVWICVCVCVWIRVRIRGREREHVCVWNGAEKEKIKPVEHSLNGPHNESQ